MIVDAEVWYWTPERMVRQPPLFNGTRYITVADAERLLEEAHRRGSDQKQEVMKRIERGNA